MNFVHHLKVLPSVFHDIFPLVDIDVNLLMAVYAAYIICTNEVIGKQPVRWMGNDSERLCSSPSCDYKSHYGS